MYVRICVCMYSRGQKKRKMRFFVLIFYFESKSKIEIIYSILFVMLIPTCCRPITNTSFMADWRNDIVKVAYATYIHTYIHIFYTVVIRIIFIRSYNRCTWRSKSQSPLKSGTLLWHVVMLDLRASVPGSFGLQPYVLILFRNYYSIYFNKLVSRFLSTTPQFSIVAYQLFIFEKMQIN